MALPFLSFVTTSSFLVEFIDKSKMLLLSALMVADRLVDIETESKVFKEKSEDFLDLKNKNKELESQRSSIENDYQKLENLVERILGKLEMVSNISDKKTDTLLSDETTTNIIETDQPKLF